PQEGSAGSRSARLEPLLDLVPRLWEATDSVQALTAVLAALRAVFGAEWGAVLRLGEGDEAPQVLCREGRRAGGQDGDFSKTVLRQLAESAGAVLQADVAADPSLADARSIHLELRSVLAATLTHRGRTLGVVYLENPASSRAFGAEESLLFERLCRF